ncbi:MAG: hypothetical protein ABI622_09700 [Chloroflexota bacterium]
MGPATALACILALAVPVAVGWGCGRGEPQLEMVSTRGIKWLDLLLACGAVGVTSAVAMLLHKAELASAGAIASRDLLAYLGLLLGAYPFVGWRVAAVMPAAYLVAVLVAGRGDDLYHPSRWAWIAADGADRSSWLLTAAVLVAGLIAYGALRPTSAAVDEP